MLHEIAGKARHENPYTLLCEPFEGARVRIHLDSFGDPTRVDTQLDSPLQPFFIESLTPTESGQGIAQLFSSQDGKPISPLQAITGLPRTEPDSGTLCLAEVWGFADAAHLAEKTDPIFACEPNSEGTFSARGHLIKTWDQRNSITGESAHLANVYYPGFITTIAFAEEINCKTGSVIECNPTFFATISDRQI